MSDYKAERRRAINNAWKNEKAHVRNGRGTRDWTQEEQRQIITTGSAKDYHGHHMKSVKDYPQHATNPDNIQFLNSTEHIKGAHRGDTQNATNGYYDPKTGITHNFGNRNPSAPQASALSNPLSQRQQVNAIRKEQLHQQAKRQAKSELSRANTMKLEVKVQTQDSKQVPTQPNSHDKLDNNYVLDIQNDQIVVNKGIESMRRLRVKSQSDAASSNKQPSKNKGIDTARQKRQ